MNDLVDAIFAGALGFGMWCFVEAPDEPVPEPVAAAAECELAECKGDADTNPSAPASRSETERP